MSGAPTAADAATDASDAAVQNNDASTSQRRPRAPTITIDTSAVSRPAGSAGEETTDARLPQLNTTNLQAQQQSTDASNPMLQPHANGTAADATETRRSGSFESRESRPTSPHNISSPTALFNSTHNSNHLMVPSQRKRGGSIDTDSSESSMGDGSTVLGGTEFSKNGTNADGQKLGAGDHPVLSDEEALKPDPGTEADFKRENNPFAFTPGLMNKMLNPKSLGAFHALGGIVGLEKGLRTDISSGLSADEQHMQGTVSFEDATAQAEKKALEVTTETSDPQTAAAPMSDASAAGSYEDRKRIFGDNTLPQRRSRTIFELAWIAYNDKVLILLTVCAVIALALGLYQALGVPREPGEPQSVEWIEGVAIIVAIVVVVVVGALNDWQKERQFVKLNAKKDDRNVKVIRSGKTQEISVHEVLAGDILQVEPGDILPVDGIFVAGHGVRCDESSATGESDILKKTPGADVYIAMENGAPLKKLDPFMISGAKVTEGFGRMIVTSTGVNSSHGRTMLALREDTEATPLQVKLNNLAEYIAKLGGSSALLLFLVLLIKFLAQLRFDNRSPTAKAQEFLNILIQAVIIVVVAVPEGLPLAVTLALAFATKRMLKDNNLVRVLRSCETMGNATCVCSDKTGTLTQNVMTVVAGAIGTSNRFSTQGSTDEKGSVGDDVSPGECIKALSPEVRTMLKDSIAINSTAFEGEEDGKQIFIGSKTETALLNFARDLLGMDKVSVERSNAQIAQMIPFDSGRKCMGIVLKLEGHGYRLLVKGASEIMLEKCTNIIEDPTRGIAATPMAASHSEMLGKLINEYASRSLRTLGFIYRDYQEWPPRHARRLEDDKTQAVFEDVCKNMTFLGVVGIQDPLRPGVKEAVLDCLKAGVLPRMVTGDNINTAKAIAKECGILTPGGVAVEGPAFRKMSKFEQLQLIPKLQILARSSPEDKRVLVRRLKEQGETVAVTGDGTNDAPALKAADIGFAMNIAGTEVAKEASDIILMDDNFTSIVKALMWGRAVNDAVRKFLQFQITVNITAVLLAFISAVASSEEQSVLKAVQLLWVNLIMDTMAALALATDPPTRAILNRKPDKKSAPLISLTMWKMIIGQAIYQLTITLILYFAGSQIFRYDNPEEEEGKEGMIFNTFVWMQIFNALNNRRLDNRFNVFENIHKNIFFIGIFLIMIGGQILIMFVGGVAFGVEVKQQPDQWAIAIVLGALSLPVGVLIRLIPNEFIDNLIPAGVKRRFEERRRNKVVITDDENPWEWNQALLDVKEELAFIKKYKGGRLRNLKFKLQNPKEMLPRSPSRSRSSLSDPSTPRLSTEIDMAPEHLKSSPNSTKRRGRSRSNSALAGAAMAGIVAGSIGGWSPIDRSHAEGAGPPWGVRERSKSDLSKEVSADAHAQPKSADAPITTVTDTQGGSKEVSTTTETPAPSKKDDDDTKQ